MKLPEPLFIVINPIIRFLLKSPLHWLMSGNVMLIHYVGRKSRRNFDIPVRYHRVGKKIHCFTGRANHWWKNMRGGAAVELTLAKNRLPYTMTAIDSDPSRIKEALKEMLKHFPQDAPYHDIKLDAMGVPNADDLERAGTTSILVEAIAARD